MSSKSENKSKIRIDVDGDYSSILYTTEDQQTKVKNVLTSNLASIFAEASKEVTVKSIEILPPSLRIKIETSKSTILGFEIPEHVGRMRFHPSVYRRWYDRLEDKPFDVEIEADADVDPDKVPREFKFYADPKCGPVSFSYDYEEGITDRSSRLIESFDSVFPGGLSFIVLTKVGTNEWRVGSSSFYQYALGGPLTDLSTPVYRWPGTNVFTEANNVCIGNIGTMKVNDLSKTGYLPWMFYNGVSNNDLEAGKINKEFCEDVRVYPYDIFRSLIVDSENPPKPYPKDALIRIGTLNDVITQLKSRS